MSPLTCSTMPVKKLVVITNNNNNNSPHRGNAYTNNIHQQTKNNMSPMQQTLIKNISSSIPNVEANAVFTTQQKEAKNSESPVDSIVKPNIVEQFKGKSESVPTSKSGKILLGAVHPYICCSLCSGYLIKATTIVECLHTFCHSCLMKHLTKEKQCPQCGMHIIKSKTNIK